MHFYAFNIGDYASHTRHLSPIEDIVYRRLLDLYYLHEKPLSERSATVARLVNLLDYEAEVHSVLNEFFELIDGTGWINQRADEEILKYYAKREQASKAGKASANKRLNDRLANDKPDKKQEKIPIKKKQKIKETRELPCPLNVSHEVWVDFLELRKAKKAPVTAAAIAGIEREAGKAQWSLENALIECCARGWNGFKAQWVFDKEQEKELSRNNWNTVEGWASENFPFDD